MAGDDAKLERITDLIFALLYTAQPIPLNQIAEDIPGYPEGHEARRQAFERDKRLLREEGIIVESVPIDGPEQFGYRIDPATFFLPDLHLDMEEQAALNLAVAGVHLDDERGEDALRKLGIVELFDVQPVASLGVVPGLDRLFQAIAAQAEVRFSYRGESRVVAPARLQLVNGRWYLAGWSKERDAGRNFRVDRIEGAISVGVPGSGEVSADKRITLSLPDTVIERDDDEGAHVTAAIKVDGLYAWKVTSDTGPERIVERHDDGSVTLEIDIGEPLIFRSWVLSLLDHVQILSPSDQRQDIVDWLNGIVAQPISHLAPPRLEELIAASQQQGDGAPRVPPAQRRVRRLLAMLEWLASVGSSSTSEMAQRFSMTKEELVAELELAACCGRPPYSPGELMDIIVDPEEVSARLPEMNRPRQLTPAEGVAVAAAAKTILAIEGADANGPLARAVVKLEEALGRQPAIEVEIPHPPLLDALRDAVDQQRQLNVEYLSLSSDAFTKRTIDPLSLVTSNGRWYLTAYCHNVDGTRTFRADRFKSVTDCGKQPPHEAVPPRRSESFIPDIETDIVTVHVDASALWVADSVPILARRDEPDGSATVALSVSGTAWFERVLLQAGTGLSILGPPQWQNTARDAAARILSHYSS